MDEIKNQVFRKLNSEDNSRKLQKLNEDELFEVVGGINNTRMLNSSLIENKKPEEKDKKQYKP